MSVEYYQNILIVHLDNFFDDIFVRKSPQLSKNKENGLITPAKCLNIVYD